LAWPSSDENIDCCTSLTVELLHVLVAGHVRPEPLEHRARVGIDLALPHSAEVTSGLKAPFEATNAREERADAHHCLHASHVVSLGQIENSAGFGSDAGLLDSKPHVVSMVSTPPLFERD
jgi:hypothetical protein